MCTSCIAVGNRCSYDGEICTIRFIGEIPAWPGETAYGVEWDNPAKGKHNGAFKGITYFHTRRNGNTGSFIKQRKAADPTVDFYGALVATYGTPVEKKEIKIGSKLVESYGFDRLQQLQSDFLYLKTISLSRKCIKGGLRPSDAMIVSERLINLEELDLSFNLFTDLKEVISIISLLSLKKLNLSGNCFHKVSTDSLPTLESLNLSMIYPNDEFLMRIPSIAPNVENLYLTSNNFTDFQNSFSKLSKLKHLDLSMNDLTSLPSKLSENSTITSLNLSENLITINKGTTTFHKITTLDIRRNEISTWEEVGYLHSYFPKLRNLRVNGNPLFDDKTSEEVEYFIIAIFQGIVELNGVSITVAERMNAELYFLSKANGSQFDYEDKRLIQLAQKYGKEIRKSPLIGQNNTIRSNLLNLVLKRNSAVIKVEVVDSLELLRLRGWIARIFQKSILEFQVSYFNGNIKEELKNDISLISSFKFVQGQVLLIEDIE